MEKDKDAEPKQHKQKCENFTDKFEKLFGFKLADVSSFNNIVKLMYRPTDPASLGITRILFGLLMLSDIPEERAGADIDLRWGEPRDCHFPLFPQIKPLGLPFMGLLYGIMWLGALGITLGYRFRLSAISFCLPYWYVLLLDKSFWNNHSYLFGLVSMLLIGTSANSYWSIDGLLDKKLRNKHVPFWNYFILKFQFFMLYFMAGLKKSGKEWLAGYSMTNLGTHWVFDPFKTVLTNEQIDYLIVHWFGFVLDLTIGFWLLYEYTRPFAMIFCASFHLMNSRLFSIGMFPYVCLATMPLFCKVDWPRKLFKFPKSVAADLQMSKNCIYSENNINDTKTKNKSNKEKLETHLNITPETKVTWKHRLVVCLLFGHCVLQGFLPYSHFITKGYNNWTEGLYGYSWDMMVHSWDTVLVVVKVVDNETGKEHFLDSNAWAQSDRWTKHADMCIQYAQCLKENLLLDFEEEKKAPTDVQNNIQRYISSENISVYIDVWCSLNGRFQQRMFDPNYDLLKANWSPFEEVQWLLPLLTEYSVLRSKITEIQTQIYSWSNNSDVLFVADFPGLHLENFIDKDLTNVSLTVLEGEIYYEMENPRSKQSFGIKLAKGDSIPVKTGRFHKIHTIGEIPSCYMYTFFNSSKTMEESEPTINDIAKSKYPMYSPFPILEDMEERFENMLRFFGHVGNSLLNIIYNIPMVRRRRVM